MLSYQELVIDAFVSGTIHTGVQHARVLAMGDRIGMQAILDAGGAHGRFVAAIEHSADGINWIRKNRSPEIDVAIDPMLPMSILGGEAQPATESLEYVRIAVTVSGTREQVHVKLYVALRDSGKGELSSCACEGEEEERSGHDEILAARPHAALADLEAHLADQPDEVHPRERLQRALGALGERERAEVVAYLERVASVVTMSGASPEAE